MESQTKEHKANTSTEQQKQHKQNTTMRRQTKQRKKTQNNAKRKSTRQRKTQQRKATQIETRQNQGWTLTESNWANSAMRFDSAEIWILRIGVAIFTLKSNCIEKNRNTGPPKRRSAPLAAAVGCFFATEPLVWGSCAAWGRSVLIFF